MSASATAGLSANANLLPAASFASAGGGTSLGASFGAGSGGLELGLGSGASASARFTGLRMDTRQHTSTLDTAALLPTPAGASFNTSAGSTVTAGGRLTGSGGGLRADVGADADFVIGGR